MNEIDMSSDREPATAWRRWAGIAAMACMVVFAGCAVTQETRRSLDGYVLAMSEVEKSANTFLNDFADGLKAQSVREQAGGGGGTATAQEYPTTFEPNLPLNATDDAVARTRQSLDVIRQYNQTLVALAEGRSEQEFRSQAMAFGGALESLVSLAGATIPGLPAFIALGPTIIKLADDAANREQLVKAIKEGREPVGKILEALEAQTSSLYRLSVVDTGQEQTRVKGDIQRASAALKTLTAAHGPPTAAELVAKVVTLEAQLDAIGSRTRTRDAMQLPFVFGAGKPAYDAAAHAQAEVFVQAMRASADKYAALVARQNAYYELLKKYVITLRQTARALDLVDASLTRPVDLRAEANRLLKVAFELRDAMAAYRSQAAGAVAP